MSRILLEEIGKEIKEGGKLREQGEVGLEIIILK